MARKLIRWKDYHDSLIILHTQYWLNENGFAVDWATIADRIEPGLSGGALVQHLAKQRNRYAEQGLRVPEPLKRGSKKTGFIAPPAPSRGLENGSANGNNTDKASRAASSARDPPTNTIARQQSISSVSETSTKRKIATPRTKRESDYDSDDSYSPTESSQQKRIRRTPREASFKQQQATSGYISEESSQESESSDSESESIETGRTSLGVPAQNLTAEQVSKIVILEVPNGLEQFPEGTQGHSCVSGKRLGPKSDTVQVQPTRPASRSEVPLHINTQLGNEGYPGQYYMASTTVLPSPYAQASMHHQMPGMMQHPANYGYYNNNVYGNMALPPGYHTPQIANMGYGTGAMGADPVTLQRFFESYAAEQARADAHAREYANHDLKNAMFAADKEYSAITELSKIDSATSDSQQSVHYAYSPATPATVATPLRQKTPVLVPTDGSAGGEADEMAFANLAASQNRMLLDAEEHSSDDELDMDVNIMSRRVAQYDGCDSPFVKPDEDALELDNIFDMNMTQPYLSVEDSFTDESDEEARLPLQLDGLDDDYLNYHLTNLHPGPATTYSAVSPLPVEF